ncbi:hypothetical protein PILCRDRAFT_439093 [Piloderma croceum F 1598]|uniref:Uncharacterized protein n=1 Tax=Piloderma croceum (strain F 1598) TaxID=765440 RepID=A0A0C3FFU3_PILCF|nr:hypothetical protein PILCRDRAFT_439093 [Piloderma croceum F 1598]
MKGPSGFRGHSRKTNRFLPALAMSDSGALCKSRIAWLESSNGDFRDAPLFASCLLNIMFTSLRFRLLWGAFLG